MVFACAMTAKTAAQLILALGLTLAPMSVRADCHDDLAALQARLDAANQKAPNVGAAKKELAKAQEEQKDEVACINGVARAWRAFRKPPPLPAGAKQ
jgi:hypothetical protein